MEGVWAFSPVFHIDSGLLLHIYPFLHIEVKLIIIYSYTNLSFISSENFYMVDQIFAQPVLRRAYRAPVGPG